MDPPTNTTTPLPTPNTLETTLLESFIPGYSILSRLLLTHLQIDLSQYLPYILTTAATLFALKYAFTRLKTLLTEHCISKAEIRLDDEIYSYLMFWMAQQPFTNRTTHFIAGTRLASSSSNSRYYDSDDEDENSDEDEYDADGNVVVSFDEYWAKAKNRDKYKTLRFSPAEGTHYFWFRGRLLAFIREKEDTSGQNISLAMRLQPERLYLSCLGRDPSILKELLAEAQRVYVARDLNNTVIYRAQKSGEYVDWTRCMARAPRALSTVILDSAQKNAFVDDIKEYLHPRTRRWYSNRGIPYRRGYLLHGLPGTGKTSLCFAAAGMLGLSLYLLNLSSRSFDEDDLMGLFQELPSRCIVLLEDVDCAGMVKKRVGGGDIVEEEAEKKKDAGAGGEGEAVATTTSKGISLSGLLNVIDGVAASEGRILVMTTNHPEKLDAALLRPGRVDRSIAFGCAGPHDIEELFSAIYSTLEGDVRAPRGRAKALLETKSEKETAAGNALSQTPWGRFGNEEVEEMSKEFSARIPSGEFTAAEIQGFLLNHKLDPQGAIKCAEDWVEETRTKRREREATVKGVQP